MGYFNLEEIKDLIPGGAAKLLEDADKFEHLATITNGVINDLIGGDIPTDPDDADDYVKLPAAFIMTKLCLPSLGNVTPEMRQQTINDYLEALEMLKNKSKDEDLEASNSGALTMIEEW